ncbi:carbonic anhydrase-related protein 10 [Folsomia candida]|uniref:carbonic anhydrase-related protein 10 n=1 Tax=Folsomia candida TaxID=158441 RepID=UPI001604D9D8|nr:carbonic anhydrase-related protein 10 [Folsomia candida]
MGRCEGNKFFVMMMRRGVSIVKTYFLLLLLLQTNKGSIAVSWEDWWTYDGISGPAFWGLINPDWALCSKGHRQSPVDLQPKELLFDPNLRTIHIDKERVNGFMTNTAHSVIFYTGPYYDEGSEPDGGGSRGEDAFMSANMGGAGSQSNSSPRVLVNITGGPLSYRYQFHEIHIHYGMRDEIGSEHTIQGYSFPAELQMYGFNAQLYSNFSEAVSRSQGIVAISVLLQLGDLSNPELRILTDQLNNIKYNGQSASVQRLSLQALLPNTDHYMTYEGSTTMPACQETVTWVVMNKPIYITKQQLHALRKLMQGDEEYQKAPLGSNFRPPQSLHNRVVRTNIDFATNADCRASMRKEMHYKANNWKNQ